MLFRNSDIEETLRHFLGEQIHSAATGHCRCYSDNPPVKTGKFQKHLSEDILIAAFLVVDVLQSFAVHRVEFSRCVPGRLVLLGRCISLSFDCYCVKYPRALELFQFLKGADHLDYVVAVHRAEVAQSECFEEIAS